MRKLFAIALFAGLIAPALAQEPPKKAALVTALPEVTLKVGDPAPALKATKWLQGTEVKSFDKGHVYVVEFWATWCGPCIVMMPHMSDLQQEFKGKATLISFTTIDKQNPAEKVAAFVEKRGPKLKYSFAASDTPETNDAWMMASGQSGIPCCFVVDKDTKIAFIGHPMFLDVVLPKVVAGTWAKDDLAALEKIKEEVNDVFKSLGGDAEASLKALAEFEKNNPKLAGIPYFINPKLGALLKTKKTAEARAFAEAVVAKATKQSDPIPLQMVSAILRSPAAGGEKESLALAVKSAEALLKVSGEKDAVALVSLAESHFAAGDKAKAKEYGSKAVAAADSEQMKASIEKLVKKYDE